MEIRNLSPETQKIIELLGGEGACLRDNVDVASVIQAHPELIKGLNEWTLWHGEEMQAIEKQDASGKVTHKISQTLKGLGGKKN